MSKSFITAICFISIVSINNLEMTLPYILAHFIGDFLLQNDWMAVGKKKSSLICTIHVLLYMTPFLFTDLSWTALSLIAVQHWIQDRTKFVEWWCKETGSFQTELKQDVLPWGILWLIKYFTSCGFGLW